MVMVPRPQCLQTSYFFGIVLGRFLVMQSTITSTPSTVLYFNLKSKLEAEAEVVGSNRINLQIIKLNAGCNSFVIEFPPI